MQRTEAQMTPWQHAQHITDMLQQAQQECRADVGRVSDPQAMALFETIAEVLGGAIKALEHYQNKGEQAWQGSQGSTDSSSAHSVRSGAGIEREQEQYLPEQQRPEPQGPQPPVTTDMAADISEDKPPPKLYTE
jgi:beta-phosphoglucomutase-like phosphatase (HAD superfamily)